MAAHWSRKTTIRTVLTRAHVLRLCCVLEVCTPGTGSRESGYEHARAHTWLLVQLGALRELTEELTPLRTATIAELNRALLCCFQAQLRIASKVGEL